MKKSGLADSPLFKISSIVDNSIRNEGEKGLPDTGISLHQSTKPPRHHDAMKPLYPETNTQHYVDALVAEIRKRVREFGKEAATYRLTEEEKRKLYDLVYRYKLKNIRTSENEITRIAINYILEDYQLNNKESILNRVIEALNE
jgi:hypothetical protein